MVEKDNPIAAVLEKNASGMDAPVLYDVPNNHSSMKTLPRAVSLSQVDKLEIKWLWEPYIQIGNITILRGNPGTGKTYFIAALMAAIADGMPNGMPGELNTMGGRCLYFGIEDDPETIRARVEACGGHSLDSITVVTGAVTFKDVDILRDMLQAYQPDLMVFDPIQTYLGADVDMNRANQLRPLLENLRTIAREYNCAILINEHMNKNQKGDDLYRGIGSMDITAAARSVLMVKTDQDDMDLRYTVQIKTNARHAPVVAWKIEHDGTFRWCGVAAESEDKLEEQRNLAKIPAVRLVLELLRIHPNGFGGTVAKMLEECPNFKTIPDETNPKMRIGRELNKQNVIDGLYSAYGVVVDMTNTNNVKNYHIYRL